MGSGTYLVILVIGAIIVLGDGQLIMRQAPSYLAEVYTDPRRARQVTGMVVGMFHLIMLGLVALVSSIGLAPDAGPRAILARLGMLLLLVALGHGATMLILSRLRDQQLTTQMAEASTPTLIPPPRNRPAAGEPGENSTSRDPHRG